MQNSTLLFLAMVCSFPQTVAAQSAFAIVEGVTKDQTGAVLPGTTLQIRSTGSGQRWTALADAQGHYVFPNLASGPAEIRAEFNGMQPHTQRLNLVAEQRITLDITLGAADVSEHVDVTAST